MNNRKRVVITLLAMFCAIHACLGIWILVNKPMTPVVIPSGGRYEVKWGKRFSPFYYQTYPMGSFRIEILDPRNDGRYRVESVDGVVTRIMTIGTNGFRSISELPPEAHRRLFEGRFILDEYREKNGSADSP